jgi:hypothetical protein
MPACLQRVAVVLAVILLSSCTTPAPQPEVPVQAPDARAERLATFARLYGYVRWFYPGDEAAEIDWNRFAIRGIGRILKLKPNESLESELENLFQPVAANLRLYREGSPAPSTARLMPKDPAGMEVVAWQHYGAGLGQIDKLYKSLRLNREPPTEGATSVMANQGIDAKPYRGQKIRLRAAVRTAVKGKGNQGHLWLSVVHANGRSAFSDGMKDRPITSGEWSVYEVEGEVPDDAGRIAFGAFLRGQGEVWVDDFELQARSKESDGWTSIDIQNPGFEQKQPGGWNLISSMHQYLMDTERPYAGQQSLRIESQTPLQGPLFEEHTLPGQVAEKSIGSGLMMQLPLALYSDAKGTRPQGSEDALDELKSALKKLAKAQPGVEDERVRLAAVVIAWNAFEHFYPYFDVVQVDWLAELPRALEAVLRTPDAATLEQALERMIATARDGHANVFPPQPVTLYRPAFRAEWIEERVVIVNSLALEHFQMGDVVLAVDGVDAGQWVADAVSRISGSPQWQHYRALDEFAAGAKDQVRKFRLLRGDQEIEVEAPLDFESEVPGWERPLVSELERGIWYVDLDRVPIEEIRERMKSLADAKGVIFDLRGYPRGVEEILCHLLEEPETASWMWVPKILYPDHDARTGYEGSGWNLKPAAPHIRGRVAFLTNGRAISYAESLLAYVEAHRLGDIVGSPTAGTNGNIRRFQLPGGFGLIFTGMRVLKHDGSTLHGIGVLPTVPVQPTLEGIRAGRDEVLDAALAKIKGED